MLLSWQDSFKKIETGPTTLFVMLLLWLWNSRSDEGLDRAERPAVLTVLSLLLITVAQSLIRAEIGMSIGLGVLALSFLFPSVRLSLSRPVASFTAILMMLFAAGTQVVMSRVVFPNAHYAPGEFFQLFYNLRDFFSLFVFISFISPFVWLYRQSLRKPFTQDGAGLAFLLASVPFLLLWVLIGRVGEVRIFIPFGLALTPYFCQTLAQCLQDAEVAVI